MTAASGRGQSGDEQDERLAELISAARDGDLSPEEAQLLEARLADSAEWQDYKNDLAALSKLIKSQQQQARETAVERPGSSRLLSAIQAKLQEAAREASLAAKPGKASSNRTSSKTSSKTSTQAASARSKAKAAQPKLGEEQQEWISGLIDDALRPTEQDSVEALLAQESEAQAFQKDLRALRDRLRGLRLVDPSPDLEPWLLETLADCAKIERAALDSVARSERWKRLRERLYRGWPPALAGFLACFAIATVAQSLRSPEMPVPPPIKSAEPSEPLPNNPKATQPVAPPPPGGSKPTDPAEPPKPGELPKPGEVIAENPNGTGQPPTGPRDPIIPKDPPKNPEAPKSVEDPDAPRPMDQGNLEALAQIIRVIRDRATMPAQRRDRLEELGFFDHPSSLQVLREVMTGGFRSSPEANSLYQPASLALARINTEESARVLWSAPIGEESSSGSQPGLHPSDFALAVGRFKNPQAATTLASLAADDTSERGYAAIQGLSQRGQHHAGEVFASILSSPASRATNLAGIHGAMAAGLGRIGGEAYLPLLNELATEAKTPAAIRLGAIEGLGELQVKDAIASLASPLAAEARRDVVIRSMAAQSLGRYADASALKLLIDRLVNEEGKRGDRRVLAAIEMALFRLTGLQHSGATAWKRWFESKGESFFSSERGTEAARSKDFPAGTWPAIEGATFGLPVQGRCLLFMLDISSSMGRNGRLDRAITELREALQGLLARAQPRKQVYFNVMLFDARSRLMLPRRGADFHLVDAANIQRVLKDLEGVRASESGTDLHAAFDVATKMLDEGQLDNIFFISDGQATRGENRLDALRYDIHRMLRGRHLSLHTIGIYNGKSPLYTDLRSEASGDEGVFKRFLRELARDQQGFMVSNHPLPKPR